MASSARVCFRLPYRSSRDERCYRSYLDLIYGRVSAYSFSVDSVVMSESVIRGVLCQALLALHHLHTAYGDRPVVVHRVISPEKRKLTRVEGLAGVIRSIDGSVRGLLTKLALCLRHNGIVLFGERNNVVLAGFGHASYHPPRGQYLQGNITVSPGTVLLPHEVP
jgi:hypothetical protein